MSRYFPRLIIAAVVCLFAFPMFAQRDASLSQVPTAATPQAVPGETDEFGIQDGNDLWLPAAAFTSRSSTTWHYVAFGYYTADGAQQFEAPITLAKGNFLVGYRTYYSDSSATNDITVRIHQYDYDKTTHTSSIQLLFPFTSSGSGGFADTFTGTNITIDFRPDTNTDRVYTMTAVMPLDAGVTFKGVRLFWRRQVAPAPLTARFADVPPSHVFFQYIEALAASGITGGCVASPLQYCPDATLTRGQMAVFMAKALGLHWAP